MLSVMGCSRPTRKGRRHYTDGLGAADLPYRSLVFFRLRAAAAACFCRLATLGFT